MTKLPLLVSLKIPTSDGTFIATYSDQGLRSLDFPSRTARTKTGCQTVPRNVEAWHALTSEAVRLALSGRESPELPPLDLSSGTAFQQRVWAALREVPAGKTRTYGEIALSLGQPGASRAVGAACGANPIPLLVPCHRVVAAGGKLGGFSGGLSWKKLLLARETVLLPSD